MQEERRREEEIRMDEVGIKIQRDSRGVETEGEGGRHSLKERRRA